MNGWDGGFVRHDLDDTFTVGDEMGSSRSSHEGEVELRFPVSTTTVMALTGASFRMLDHWVRQGWISPDFVYNVGAGQQRSWSEEQVARAATLVSASRIKQMPLPRIAKALEQGKIIIKEPI